MEISIIQRPDEWSQVALSGRLDPLGVQKVENRFHGATAARGHHSIIDISRVDFIASLGLSMLLSSARSLHHRGARMVLVNPQPLVMKVLETAQFPQVIPVVATVADAEALLGAKQG